MQTRMIGRKMELEFLRCAVDRDGGRWPGTKVMSGGEAEWAVAAADRVRGVGETDCRREVLVSRSGNARGPVSTVRSAAGHVCTRFQIEKGDALLEVRQKLEDLFSPPINRSGRMDLETKEAHLIGQFLGYDFGDSPLVKPIWTSRNDCVSRLGNLGGLSPYPCPPGSRDRDPGGHPLGRQQFVGHPYPSPVRLDQVSLLVVGAGRPNLYQRRPQWGEGLAYHRRLDLQPLSKRQVGQLLDELLQRAVDVPGKLRELVVAGADGNPFFVEELVRMLIEEGVIWLEQATKASGGSNRSGWQGCMCLPA